MTVPSLWQSAQLSAPAGLGTSTPDPDLGEELCRVQADILEMGTDNYERLKRVCPDPDRRYRVLQRRVNHQVQLALAGSPPRWRQDAGPDCEARHTSPAAREMWVELDARGEAVREVHTDVAARRGDGFSPGPPRDAERCWRCDARDAASDIGLCEPCHVSLTSR